jgi:hypothetical protein
MQNAILYQWAVIKPAGHAHTHYSYDDGEFDLKTNLLLKFLHDGGNLPYYNSIEMFVNRMIIITSVRSIDAIAWSNDLVTMPMSFATCMYSLACGNNMLS